MPQDCFLPVLRQAATLFISIGMTAAAKPSALAVSLISPGWAKPLKMLRGHFGALFVAKRL